MKNASNVRLSLRKLLIATMAVGPLAVLPAPVWAAVPVTQQFTATSGTASYTTSGANIGTITASDKSVLVWTGTNFNIAAGDTINFTLPTGGAVLNKIGYATTGALGTMTNVSIDGTLFSTGKVFVLANGSITVGGTASITTNGGLYLSTLEETSDFSFATVGSLNLSGASTGTITIGAAGASPSISGNLEATAGSITSHRAAVSGDVVYRSVTAAAGLDLAASAALAVGGNLSVTTNAGAITGTNAVTVGVGTTGNQTATLSTGTGAVNVALTNAANDFEIISVTAPGAANVSLADANIITIGASTIGQDLFVTATGTAASTGIASSGTITIGRDASFVTTTANSGVSIGNNSTIVGSLSGSTNSSSFSFSALGNVTIGTANALNGITTGAASNYRSSISVTASGGALNVNQALVTAGNGTSGGGVTLTAGSITTAAAGTISQTAAVGSTTTINATTGSISIGGAITADRVTVRTAGGSISQTATITTATSGNQNTPVANVFNAGAGAITLTQANALAAGSTLQLTGSTASVTNTNGLWLGTTNLTGAATINITNAASPLQIGAGLGTAGQVVNIGGLLTVTTNGGAITDQDYGAQTITGGLNLTTAGGAFTLNAATTNGVLSPLVQFGSVAINSGAGAINITESTTLNLGAITTTGGLTARSVNGGIVDSGVINVGVAGASSFQAAATDSIVLDNAGHSLGTLSVLAGNATNAVLTGATTILSGATNTPGLTLTSASGIGLTLGSAAGTATVTELTVSSGGTISLDGAIAATTASLTSADATATSITDTGLSRLVVSGNTTLSSSGGIVLDSVSNDFNNVIFNGVALNAAVDDANNITASGTATGTVTVRSGANNGIGAAWNVVLGNLTAGGLVARAQDGTGGTGGGVSGTITQSSGTTLAIFGPASFTTDGANIVINNTGNNFGQLSATAGNAGITLREGGTIKLGTISNNGTAASITSETGSIIEESAIGGVATSYSTTNATLTLTAANGSIQLGRLTNVVGGPATVGATTTIAASAPTGSVQLFSSTANLALANITANSFSVNHTGTGNLTQSGWVRSFGAAAFSSAGNIIAGNTTNNFGRVSLTLTTGARNATLTEAGTLNLGTVSQVAGAAGNLTLTSVAGDIVDSGLAGVRLGGTTAAPGTGIVTLAAAAGNIVLDDPTTEFATSGGVVFNGGNVTLSGLGQSTIWLGAAALPSTAGNLTVTSAIGSIANSGNLTVAGTTFFQAGAGNITLNQSANQFGSLRFVGNQVSIAQTNSMNILTGSSAIGQAQLASTGGNVTISNVGGGAVSFGNTASISASGTIILPKLVQAVGTLTLTASGTKDLSALSLASDLSGKTPVNVGTGTYLPPAP